MILGNVHRLRASRRGEEFCCFRVVARNHPCYGYDPKEFVTQHAPNQADAARRP